MRKRFPVYKPPAVHRELVKRYAVDSAAAKPPAEETSADPVPQGVATDRSDEARPDNRKGNEG